MIEYTMQSLSEKDESKRKNETFRVFLSAIIYGIKYLFSLVYSILVMVLFIPTIFIFYNESASFYIGVYGGDFASWKFIRKFHS